MAVNVTEVRLGWNISKNIRNFRMLMVDRDDALPISCDLFPFGRSTLLDLPRRHCLPMHSKNRRISQRLPRVQQPALSQTETEIGQDELQAKLPKWLCGPTHRKNAWVLLTWEAKVVKSAACKRGRLRVFLLPKTPSNGSRATRASPRNFGNGPPVVTASLLPPTF